MEKSRGIQGTSGEDQSTGTASVRGLEGACSSGDARGLLEDSDRDELIKDTLYEIDRKFIIDCHRMRGLDPPDLPYERPRNRNGRAT